MNNYEGRQIPPPPPATPASPRYSQYQAATTQSTNLADLLERVLDKGIVIAGDIVVSIGDVQLLTIQIRLLIASIDKAQEIGVNWWQSDPALSSRAKALERERLELHERLDQLEQRLAAVGDQNQQSQQSQQSEQEQQASSE